MSDNRSKDSNNMVFTAEAVRDEIQHAVKGVAALGPSDSRKAALSFAARALGLKFTRVRELFYGNARRIEAHEADQIRAYVAAVANLIEAREAYETKRQNFVRNHPSLVRFAPGPLRGSAVSPGGAQAQTKD